jgi:hypothetical protein
MNIRVTVMFSFPHGYQNVRCHSSQDHTPLIAANSSRKTQKGKVGPVLKPVFTSLVSMEELLPMCHKGLIAGSVVLLLLKCQEKLFVKSYYV